MQHLAALFDALQVGLGAPAARNRPSGAAGQHVVYLLRVEVDRAGAAQPRGNVLEQRIGEVRLHEAPTMPGSAATLMACSKALSSIARSKVSLAKTATGTRIVPVAGSAQ